MPTRLQTQIEAFLNDLQHKQARSANTLLAYRTDLAQFSTFVQQKPSAHAAGEAGFALAQVEAWQTDLIARGKAPTTVARKMAALASFCNWLAAQGLIDQDATGKSALYPMHSAQNTQPAAQLLAPHEVDHLLKRVEEDATTQGMRDRAIFAAIALLGLRVGEVAQLNAADVDSVGRRIHCRRRGGVSSLLLKAPVDSIIAHYLVEGRPHLQVDPDEAALFLNHRGKRLTRQGIWLIVKRNADAAGITAEITPRALRHAMLQREIERGLAAQAFAERAGTSAKRSKRDYKRAAAKSAGKGATITIDGEPYLPGSR
jgi:integrase/recombinase XerD